MKRSTAALAIAAAFVTFGTSLAAQSQGDWTLGLGVGWVDPKSDNGTLAGGSTTIDSDARPTITGEYFIRDNVGIELLAATPFSHDISINGTNVGSTKQLPPTLSVNYHFPTQSAFKPYVGLGVNYTTFFDESSPLGTLDIDDSFGVAVQAGLDYELNDRGALRFNVRWINIESDVALNGTNIGTVKIDPIVVGAAYVFKF